MNLLFIGDVVGKGGREAVKALVPELRREKNCRFVIVNGENSAAGNGLTSGTVADLLTVADVVTAGDHVWDQRGFERDITVLPRVIRPANLKDGQPGRGYGVFRNPSGGEIAVISLQGKVFMRDSAFDPFDKADEILRSLPPAVKNIIVDFHAEATSEKLAMGYYLDGRITAMFGTHTHVRTADACVLPGGTARITDAGMAGAERSVLGRSVEDVLSKFTTGMPNRLEVVEKGDIRVDCTVVNFDHMTGKASGIESFSRIVAI